MAEAQVRKRRKVSCEPCRSKSIFCNQDTSSNPCQTCLDNNEPNCTGPVPTLKTTLKMMVQNAALEYQVTSMNAQPTMGNAQYAVQYEGLGNADMYGQTRMAPTQSAQTGQHGFSNNVHPPEYEQPILGRLGSQNFDQGWAYPHGDPNIPLSSFNSLSQALSTTLYSGQEQVVPPITPNAARVSANTSPEYSYYYGAQLSVEPTSYVHDHNSVADSTGYAYDHNFNTSVLNNNMDDVGPGPSGSSRSRAADGPLYVATDNIFNMSSRRG